MSFHAIKTFLRSLLLPPSGLLLLALLGAILLARHHRRSGWTCLIAGLASTFILSMPVVADRLTLLVQHYPAYDPRVPTQAQAIVILGGVSNRIAPEYGGQLAAELELLERLDYGAWLSRQTHLPILVTSDDSNAFSMAVALGRDFQVPPRWVDSHSHDTYENARNSAAMLRVDHVSSILLVTSSTHMLRSVREFSATGLAVTAAPCQIQLPRGIHDVYMLLPSAESMMRSNRAIYELLGEPVRELLEGLHLRRQQPV